MSMELVLDLPHCPSPEPRLDLWSELNRIVQGAIALNKQFDAVEAALPSGGGRLDECATLDMQLGSGSTVSDSTAGT